MAQYGYSTGYQGGGPSPVPSGYIEAYGNAGRAIGSGIASIGQDIGNTIREYAKNKAEDQYATAKIESLISQYIKPGEQGPTQGGATADLEAVSQIVGEKNLKAFVEGKANRMQKLAIAHSLETYGVQEHQRQQNELLATQVAKAKEDLRQEKAKQEATRNILGMPTTVSGTTTTYGLAPNEVSLPAAETQGPPELDTQGYIEALKKFGTQDNSQKIAEIQSKIDELKSLNTGAAPQIVTVPNAYGPSFGGLAPQVRIKESEQGAAIRAAEAMQKQAQLPALQAQLSELKSQPIPQLPQREQFLVQPPIAPAGTFPVQGPPEKVVTGTQTTVQQVPWAEFRGRIAQELARQGIPVTPEAIDQLARIAGVQPPIQVQTTEIPGGGRAIQLNSEKPFYPQRDLQAEMQANERLISAGPYKGMAKTTKQQMDFSQLYTDAETINKSVDRLIEIMDKHPAGRLLSPSVRQEISDNMARVSSAIANKELTGGGPLTDTDREQIAKAKRNPNDIFAWPPAVLQNLKSQKDFNNTHLENTFKSVTIPGTASISRQSQPYNSGAVKSLSYDPVSGKLK